MAHVMARRLCRLGVAVCLTLAAGCKTAPDYVPVVDAPREMQKVSHPPYVVEPPDILVIDAIRLVPKGPYKINPLDAVLINATNVLPTEPIGGVYPVEPEGRVNLGISYGSVSVVDLTTDQAREAIVKQLKDAGYKEPQVVVSLAQSRALQQIRGEHLVRPDGTVSLGTYGSAYVAGMTLDQVRTALETHLSESLYKPELSVDVAAYNSKVYYVITDGGGAGEQVAPFPSTGNETVLDAVSKVGGLSPVASKKRIWVARPAPAGCDGEDQILPVDWVNLTQRGRTATNYQVLPGDRVYVMSQPLVQVDTFLSRLYAPIERTFGIILLGTNTVNEIKFPNGGNNGNRTGG
jgi:polysaccharide export outer membrane protein